MVVLVLCFAFAVLLLQKACFAILLGGEAIGSPDGNSPDNSMSSQSQVEIDHPEGIHMKFP